MNLDQLKTKLSKFGHLQIIKEGVVFIVLITGTGLSKWQTVNAISELVMQCVGDKYKFIEAMKNDENFFCLILKPETT